MKITLSNLNTKNLATLALRIVTASEKSAYESIIKNNPLYLNLKEEYGNYEAVYLKETYSGMGADVAAADEKRDIPFRGLRSILAGYALVDGFTYQADAQALCADIERIGQDLNRSSYSEETARMNNSLKSGTKRKIQSESPILTSLIL